MCANRQCDFSEFLQIYPRFKKLEDDAAVINLFNYLNRPEIVFRMDVAGRNGKPALSAVIGEVEDCGLDFSDEFLRRAVGAMAAAILRPFGFTPVKSGRMTAEFFSTASVYEKTLPPRVNLVHRLSVRNADVPLGPDEVIL